MADEELSTTGLKMGMRGQHGSSLNEAVIGSRRVGMGGSACIVECSKDTRRSLFFNKFADNLVVEEFDGRPGDLLADVFLLLGLEC